MGIRAHDMSLDKCCDAGLNWMIEEATQAEALLNLFLTNKPSLVTRIRVIPGLSDHDIVLSDIIISINLLTARVVGAPYVILQPVFCIFPCSLLPSGTC